MLESAPLALTLEEWDVLRGEPANLLKLYLAIRARLEPLTGLAGPIDASFLRRALYVTPVRGRSSAGFPSPKVCRDTLDALERLRLVRRRPELGKGMFLLPLAPVKSPPWPAVAGVILSGGNRFH